MALQPSGPIKMSDIKRELATTSNSLRTYSSLAGKSAPDAMSEFYGYSSYVPPDPIDFTYTFGGSYRNEGTLLVTSATGGTGTKYWYLLKGATEVGPFAINTNTQTGLGNQNYTMIVRDSLTPTPAEKIKSYRFDLQRRIGTTINNFYIKFISGTPGNDPGLLSTFTNIGAVEVNTQDTSNPFYNATEFNTGNQNDGFYYISDGSQWKVARMTTDGALSPWFDPLAYTFIMTANGGIQGTLAAPPPPSYPPYGPTGTYSCDYTTYIKTVDYHNGSGGYTTVLEYNSPDCGYVAPPPPSSWEVTSLTPFISSYSDEYNSYVFANADITISNPYSSDITFSVRVTDGFNEFTFNVVIYAGSTTGTGSSDFFVSYGGYGTATGCIISVSDANITYSGYSCY